MAQALQLARDLEVNIHTDPKFAFHLLHSHMLSGKKGACSPPRGPQVTCPSYPITQAGSPSAQVSVLHHKGQQQAQCSETTGSLAQSPKQPRGPLQGPPRFRGLLSPSPSQAALQVHQSEAEVCSRTRTSQDGPWFSLLGTSC